MDDSAVKTSEDVASITKEEEGYVSATDEFPPQLDEVSPLEESQETSKILNSPKKRQEDVKYQKNTDSSVTAQNTTSPDSRTVKKRQMNQKNSPVKKSIEPSSTEGKQSENRIPVNYDPDPSTEVLKEHRDLIVSSLEQHLKALVQEMIKQCLPTTEKYQEVSEKLQNISIFPKLLKEAIPKHASEENSSIPRTKYFQKRNSEMSPKKTRGNRNSRNDSESKSPRKQNTFERSPKTAMEKRSNSARPLLLKYTDGIDGGTKELLICTADTIDNVSRSNPKGNQSDIIQNLLKISNRYVGKPLHVIFNPRNLPDDANEEPPPLHPSPGRHDLFQPLKKSEEKSKEYVPSKSKDVQHRTLESFFILNATADEIGEETSRKKLKIRQVRRRKSRTALKRVDIKQVVSSVFKNSFHFYALLGGHLKSGAVITRFSSNIWLKQAGVVEDERSLETASDVFMAVAGSKLVLNIFDYLKFLILYARQRRIVAAELVNQLTICKIPQCHLRERFRCENCRRGTSSEYASFLEQNRMEAYSPMWLRSLPNL